MSGWLRRAQRKAAWRTSVDLAISINLMFAAAIGLGYVPMSAPVAAFLHFVLWPNIVFAVVSLFFLVVEVVILGNPERYE